MIIFFLISQFFEQTKEITELNSVEKTFLLLVNITIFLVIKAKFDFAYFSSFPSDLFSLHWRFQLEFAIIFFSSWLT